jgi:hypothetical protein
VLADKLDTHVVSGLQDDDLDRDAIAWAPIEHDVRPLAKRISWWDSSATRRVRRCHRSSGGTSGKAGVKR